jgi:hypothetical protein
MKQGVNQMENKISLFVVYHKGSPFYGKMYGFQNDAKDSAKVFNSRFVEIKQETFQESEVYYAGYGMEGPIYALISEFNKKSVPWSEKFKHSNKN